MTDDGRRSGGRVDEVGGDGELTLSRFVRELLPGECSILRSSKFIKRSDYEVNKNKDPFLHSSRRNG